jgi:hypothetical protein
VFAAVGDGPIITALVALGVLDGAMVTAIGVTIVHLIRLRERVVRLEEHVRDRP